MGRKGSKLILEHTIPLH